ncbi:MAG: hypothetical protein HBSAPP04_14630 [Ignavibacteriaceae bacterium]|nr:MAG: hypothetical protein HBSAPP04_14630 [Ignavibacteriaceae bacterium]
MNLPTKTELKQVGLTLTAVAEILDCHLQTVRQALAKETPTTGKIRILLTRKRREAGIDQNPA